LSAMLSCWGVAVRDLPATALSSARDGHAGLVRRELLSFSLACPLSLLGYLPTPRFTFWFYRPITSFISFRPFPSLLASRVHSPQPSLRLARATSSSLESRPPELPAQLNCSPCSFQASSPPYPPTPQRPPLPSGLHHLPVPSPSPPSPLLWIAIPAPLPPPLCFFLDSPNTHS